MNMRIWFLSCLVILPCFMLHAQKEGTQWYFGVRAGIDFVSGTAYSTKRGQLSSQESSSAVCDGQGNLLFYTGGSVVYNRDHEVMPNGRGLSGHSTTTQSGLIVPVPESPDFYFVFTAGGVGENFGAFSYSVVDMSLDGGKGDVIARNIPLFRPSCEKMAAIPHANGCDIWVIGHEYESDVFHAYLVNQDGVADTPVSSKVGSVHAGVFPAAMNAMHEKNAQGQMAHTLNGRKLAVTIFEDGIIELFDFDANTGVISNPLSLDFKYHVYGLAFSPDGTKLYASTREYFGKVYQLDLEAGSAADILASTVELGTVPTDGPGAIQLGPDGKLYIARWRQDHLAVINHPNRLGAACDFVLDGIYLKRKICGLGLPVMYGGYLTVPAFNVYNECAEGALFFNFDDAGIVDQVKWDFADPSGGPSNVSQSFTPRHIFSEPGTYSVQLIRQYKNGTVDTTTQAVTVNGKPQLNIGPDTIVCEGTELILDVTTLGKGVSYLWQDSTTAPTYTVKEEGIYEVFVTNECGTSTAKKIVAYATPAAFDLGPVQGLCPDSTRQIAVSEQRLTSYKWQDGTPGAQWLLTEPGTYTLTATNACGVFSDDLVVTEANCDCILSISNVFTPNQDGSNDQWDISYTCRPTRFQMRVYDRWGHQVFMSEAMDQAWDGTCGGANCPAGVYYYQIEFVGDPQVTTEVEQHAGTVTLLR